MKPQRSTTVVLNDDDTSAAPRYDVTSASALAAAGAFSVAGAGSVRRTSAPMSSRGSAMAPLKATSPFLIVAVAENRAREIGSLLVPLCRHRTRGMLHLLTSCATLTGVCAVDLVAPYELLLWSIIDSHAYADTVSLLHAYQVRHEHVAGIPARLHFACIDALGPVLSLNSLQRFWSLRPQNPTGSTMKSRNAFPAQSAESFQSRGNISSKGARPH